MSKSDVIRHFSISVADYIRPEKFNFPFSYSPHPLAILAANELQKELETSFMDLDFGLNKSAKKLGLGKMFGVLVVENIDGKLNYLAAFSGKLADNNYHLGFVPPVFDVFESKDFFRKGEAELNKINRNIYNLENSSIYLKGKKKWHEAESSLLNFKIEYQLALKDSKEERKLAREKAFLNLTPEKFLTLKEQLKVQSIKEQVFFKHELIRRANQNAILNSSFFQLSEQLTKWKTKRKNKSLILQQKIFRKFTFLDQANNKKSLLDIFKNTIYSIPPAGAGECAAPKLLQYAFLNKLKPICISEFWWGAAPNSKVRQHKQFYPACKSKCEPILKHMLNRTAVDENPFLEQENAKELEIIFEDAYLLFVNKPAGFLSVPGKVIRDSVYERIKASYPNATGPLLVHRLDMSTSGILMIAKTKEIHFQMQKQFLQRTIKKKYEAILDGYIERNEGEINLPLRVDLDERPKQLVCHEFGKISKTRYQVLNRENNTTRILFSPLTGRTHQLRVHAAHHLGLACPILGDDLYGTESIRLHLHAKELIFIHPISKKKQRVHCKVPF